MSDVIDKHLVYFYVGGITSIEQVGGDKIYCNGWGGSFGQTRTKNT